MLRTLLLPLAVLAGFLARPWVAPPVARAGPEPVLDVEEMLQDFVDDYAEDPHARHPFLFGVRVQDADVPDWHVEVRGGEEPEAFLFEGFPEEPMPFFETDRETLTRIHQGRLAGLTAMGKAWSTDAAPLDLRSPEDYRPSDEDQAHLLTLCFHFWTRGFPEIVPFGDLAATRELHGGNGVLFYYQPGFRSGWFHLSEGQHVNEEEDMQTNPFPSLVIGTRGRIQARIGGRDCELREGQAMFIGPGVSHEFWVEEGTAEGILLMFGDGA